MMIGKVKMFALPQNAKGFLLDCGELLVLAFCSKNGLPRPAINRHELGDWHVNSCAYYRPDTPANRNGNWVKPGINICAARCAAPCGKTALRQWSWPGNTVDRTPYGVLAHELGHHVDCLTGERKCSYGSEFSTWVMDTAGEKPLTGYCDNPWEWFAEQFRLYLVNPDLLRLLRPRTYALLSARWQPIETRTWREALLPSGLEQPLPERIVRAIENKLGKQAQLGEQSGQLF